MADSFVQVAPDSTGKKVQTYENTVGANTVEAQAVVLVDSTGAPITLPTIASTTNLLAGDGSGNAVASSFAHSVGSVSDTWYHQHDFNGATQIGLDNYDTGAGATCAVNLQSDVNNTIIGINSVAGSGESYVQCLQASQFSVYLPENKPIIFWSSDGSAETFRFNGNRTVASGASVTLDNFKMSANTSTVTGTTQITRAKGFNAASIYRPTYTDSSAVTIDRGATLYIEDAPAAAGSVTLTAPYALWVDNGISRLDGGIKTTEAAPTSGKILKSNGTVFTDSTETYAAPGTSGNVMTSDGTNWTSAPAVAGSPLAKAGVAATPTATQTDTITHGLGRAPTIIRLVGMGTFTANNSAVPTPNSHGIWCSSGNRCIYQGYNTAAITTTQAAATSTTFAIRVDTGANSFITGVVQNVTATTFDIAWTETGTTSAQVYMWDAQ